MKKISCSILIVSTLLSALLTGCGRSGGENCEVIVYNWGEYIDPETISMFEEETGIKVVYDEFETNEIMYPKVEAGATAYDVICPSDYMIQKMIDNDLLAEINFDNIPNMKNIGQQYFDQSKEFDPENKYSVPYCFGTVGILYNKT
ncbi:MAG: extracellular solute-binding protein, partial [Lachnospiraceae bacterium]|nr:extracellular solute-binding protein [Lachnospiraceae bacterium]